MTPTQRAVPVSLTDIETRKDGPPGSEMWQIVGISLTERAVMCAALRIAVAALDEMSGDCRCGFCSESRSVDALARVRELVDLP